MNLILASTSKYRQKLLERLGVAFTSVPPQVDENAFKQRLKEPVDLAATLAKAKAESLWKTHPEALVIGSDQVCALGQEIFSKPGDFKQAFATLQRLQGQTHFLYTGVAVLGKNIEHVWVHETKLVMKSLSSQQIETYLRLDEPFDCAGSYKIEKHGIGLFQEVLTEDFTGIEGLPLVELSLVLEKCGISVFNGNL